MNQILHATVTKSENVHACRWPAEGASDQGQRLQTHGKIRYESVKQLKQNFSLVLVPVTHYSTPHPYSSVE